MIETKIVRQHDQRDCGAACLSMIGRYYGVRYPITKYREWTKTDKMGANLYGIVDGARRIGLTAEALSGSPDELFEALSDGSVCFPFISHTISNDVLLHYVVVTGIKKGKFVIADPAKGRYLLTPEEFFEIWTGYIVTFQKTAEFIEGDFEKGSNTRFFLLLKGQYHKLLGILLLSLIISAVGILGAFVFEVVIDRFATDTGYYETHGAEVCGDDCTDNHDHQVSDNPIDSMIEGIASVDFNIMFIALIVLYMLLTGIQFVRGYLIIDVAKKIDLSLSLSYYLHIIDLPMSSLNTRQTGEYLSRLSDTDAIRTAISSATVTLLMDTIMVIGCGVILYSLNKEMFFVALLMVVLYAIIVLCYRKPVESSNRVAMEKNALLQSYFKETIDGLATVKAACANQAAKDTISSKLHAFMDAVVKNNLISMTQDTLSGTVELVGTALILWIGFGLVLAEQVTIGSLVTFYVLLAYFTTPIKNIIELQPTIQTAVVAADRLNDVLELSTEEDGKKSADLEEIQELEFRNVNFRYGNRELVLDDVSLTVRSGEKIGIVGQSGSGKTTLAKLLLRFYDLETGRIMLNGQDISTIELNVLRKNIAYVDQDIFFFSETIRNNLRLGNRELTDDEIVEACKVSQAHQFITELPMGYDTPLDENAANLSGGQRQRLAIARALLKRPKVLLLDEATSNLDMVTEMSIRTTMMNMNEKMISIIIAHRLSTVKNCDRIYVMDRGKIVECGTHEELLRAGKKYAELWNNQ